MIKSCFWDTLPVQIFHNIPQYSAIFHHIPQYSVEYQYSTEIQNALMGKIIQSILLKSNLLYLFVYLFLSFLLPFFLLYFFLILSFLPFCTYVHLPILSVSIFCIAVHYYPARPGKIKSCRAWGCEQVSALCPFILFVHLPILTVFFIYVLHLSIFCTFVRSSICPCVHSVQYRQLDKWAELDKKDVRTNVQNGHINKWASTLKFIEKGQMDTRTYAYLQEDRNDKRTRH